ncbi:MAG: hypothetical protein KAI47_07425, partial [Deltaproteobacteria bacterium]|nr:hypothetical protein [Deltaproteobacteria bacterium]
MHATMHHYALSMLALALGIASSLSCNPAKHSHPFSLLRYRGIIAPPLPDLCGGHAPQAETVWVLFTSQYCQQCRNQLVDLRHHAIRLRQRGVTLVLKQAWSEKRLLVLGLDS